MKSQQIFCGACDREVRVMITDAPPHEGQAPLTDEEVICLEIGDKCTGNVCPLGAAGPDAMVARLVRNGLPIDQLKTSRSRCPSCDREAEMILYGNGRATCSLCGRQGRWALDHAEPLI